MTEPTGLPPEQEAVRRLLADARHDGATPPEVIARLDEALASLRSEIVTEQRDTTPSVAPVVDLGARRRRLAGVGLLAAAAVVVAGVAIGQGLPRMQGSSDAGSAAGESATSEREFGAAEDSGGSDADRGNLAEAPQEPQAKESYLTPGLAGYPNLLTFDEDLDDDLLELRATESSASSTDESARTTTGCGLRGIGSGRRVAAQIDGSLGLVVFRRSEGETQQVELYVCGDPQAVRTLTLPAP